MGPGVNELKKMHKKWKEGNVGKKDILKKILAGDLEDANLILSKGGSRGDLSGVRISLRRKHKGKGSRVHCLALYHDVLIKSGFKSGDIISPVVACDGKCLALVKSDLVGVDGGYKLCGKTKNGLSLRLEFTANNLPSIKNKRIPLSDITTSKGAILFDWDGGRMDI